jgi:hypothetical protein
MDNTFDNVPDIKIKSNMGLELHILLKVVSATFI